MKEGLEKAASSAFEVQMGHVEKTLIEYGHLKEGEQISEELHKDVRSGKQNSETIAAICRNIERSKIEGGQGLLAAPLHVALRYGLKNLAEIRLPGHYMREDFHGVSFQGANFSNAQFHDVDFGNADLDGIRCEWTKFSGSNLNNVRFTHVQIDWNDIDLTDGELRVKDGTWDLSRAKGDANICADCEVYHAAVLGLKPLVPYERDMQKYRRRGIVLFQDNKPLGLMKLKGEKSFLAMRTVRAENDSAIFWKGMIYALEDSIQNFLQKASESYKDATVWRRADVEAILHASHRSNMPIERNNMRFIEDHQIYPALSVFRQRIEAGEEEFVDIFSPARQPAAA